MAGKRFDVAVFPLVNAVLFPGVTLPLHIFEERYGQMLSDVMARGWPLAVSLATPRTQSEFALNTICGAGEVQVSKAYPDGRSDILVHGKQRVRLCTFVQQEPYLIMEAEAVEDPPLASLTVGGRTYEEFTSLVKAWAFLNPGVPDEMAAAFDTFTDAGELSDFFVFHFVKKAPDKQVYLNCLNREQRADMLARYLETDLVRLARKVQREKRSALLH